MAKPEVVAYLNAHLKKFAVDALRRQLSLEGVSEAEFDEALKTALSKPPAARKSRAGILFLAGGVSMVAALAAFVALNQQTPAPFVAKPPAQSGESAFVGHTGYVVRLPKDYSAVTTFKDSKKKWEVVHFCKTGTDPTNFLNEGLYGQLGIVRLEIEQNIWAGALNGQEQLVRAMTQRLKARGDKFISKNLQISSLRGIQVIVELPNPGVTAYILGEKVLYHFTAGQDDEIYRDILNSLRDSQSEN